MRVFFIFFLIFSLPKPLFSEDNAGAFLRYGFGARALGMGGAFVALSDDATSIYWNPAGVSQTKGLQITSMYTNRFTLSVKDHYIGISKRVKKNLAIGVGFFNTLVEDIPKTALDENRRAFIESYFKESNNCALFTLSKKLSPSIYFGLNLKYIYLELDERMAKGYGFDAGILFKGKPLSFGLNLQDVGDTEIKWETAHKESIPQNIKVGFSLNLGKGFKLCVDVDERRKRAPLYHAGFELLIGKELMVRAGFNQKDEELKIENCFSAGGSIKVKFIQLDYAYCAHTLGDTHLFSFTLKL
jgi:hypothetical protein